MKLGRIIPTCLLTLAALGFVACSDDTTEIVDLPPYRPISGDKDKPDNPGGDTPEIFTEGEVELDNGQICIKQDLGRGGAICYLSKSGVNRNVVNIYDEGRYIQQSYYAGHAVNRQSEGQSPNWSPWPWNPIQCGNYAGGRARILTCERTGNSLYVKCVPMLWDMNKHEAEAIMEQWTTIEGTVVHVRNKITCNRTDNIYDVVSRDQEIPAVYPISALSTLYTYFGDAPFTDAAMSTPEVKPLVDKGWERYNSVPEKWMAFVDGTGWGLGVYSPKAELFLAGYTGGFGGEADSPSTDYISPVCKVALDKNSVMEYDYYLVLDNIRNIRKSIYDIHKQENNNNN